jgi:hypothetical protein
MTKLSRDTADIIIGTQSIRGIALDKLASQSYDYASAMSGQYNGAHQKVSEILDCCVPYILCQVHRLSIVAKHSAIHVSVSCKG